MLGWGDLHQTMDEDAQALIVLSSRLATPHKVRTSSARIASVAKPRSRIAIASVIMPARAVPNRMAAIAEVASGKLIAHHDSLNGQQATAWRNRPTSTDRMNSVWK